MRKTIHLSLIALFCLSLSNFHVNAYAFDGFDDDGGSTTLGSSDSNEETMDGSSTGNAYSSDIPSENTASGPEEAPDPGFHAVYSPDDE